jgi:hypothetical protein
MRPWISSLLLVITLGLSGAAFAAEHTPATQAEAPEFSHAAPRPAARPEAFPHPQISANGSWAGSMAIIIFLSFIAAAVIGPIVRSETPEEVPPAHAHDEPPGSSHHHGHSGTHAEDPHH